MHPQNPRRHGPYHKLAYVHRGRPVCRFVRTGCLAEVQKRLVNYKKFRAIIDRWIDLSIQRGMIEFFRRPSGSRVRGENNARSRGKGRLPGSKPK